MKLIIVICSLIIANISHACDESLAIYLDQAKSIATKLSQVNKKLEKSINYDDQYWIRDPALGNIGGYRFILHDIAVSYAKNGCWQQALSTTEQIENLGVKDSAWAQIAIEYGKKDSFEKTIQLLKIIKYPEAGRITRQYVSKELARAGHYEQAKKVLRGAGIFGNRYESFYYKNAMNLAHSGEPDKAVEYLNKLHGMRGHYKNAAGDMLLLFQEKGDLRNADKILSYHSSGNDAPLRQISLYYLKEKNIEKSHQYISKLSYPLIKASLLLDLAKLSKNEQYYNQALEIIDKRYKQDSKRNSSIVTLNAHKVYLLKGHGVSKVQLQFYKKYMSCS